MQEAQNRAGKTGRPSKSSLRPSPLAQPGRGTSARERGCFNCCCFSKERSGSKAPSAVPSPVLLWGLELATSLFFFPGGLKGFFQSLSSSLQPLLLLFPASVLSLAVFLLPEMRVFQGLSYEPGLYNPFSLLRSDLLRDLGLCWEILVHMCWLESGWSPTDPRWLCQCPACPVLL